MGRVFGLGGLVAQAVNLATDDPHGLSVPGAQIPVLDALKESLASRIPLPTVIPEFSDLKGALHVKPFQVDDETDIDLHGEDDNERVGDESAFLVSPGSSSPLSMDRCGTIDVREPRTIGCALGWSPWVAIGSRRGHGAWCPERTREREDVGVARGTNRGGCLARASVRLCRWVVGLPTERSCRSLEGI